MIEVKKNLKKILHLFKKRPLEKILYKLFDYKILYKLSFLKSRMPKISSSNSYDIIFVIGEGNQGWILESICKRIAANLPEQKKFKLVYGYFFPDENHVFTHRPTDLPDLPQAKVYFFSHFLYYIVCLRLYPKLWNARNIIFYTHPRDIPKKEALINLMNYSSKIICMNSEFVNNLVEQGIDSSKVTYILAGCDSQIFQAHQRTGKGFIGFCCAYYPRKNPDKILNVVQKLSEKNFILLGKDWEKYDKFDQLISCKNFSYIQTDYSEYPKYYNQMDVFLSLSQLEGGPIPLIETMMSNVVPIATKTGFAADIITHGENGYLIDKDDSIEVICDYIEKAFKMDTDIRKTVEHLTWENFSQEVISLAFSE